MDLFIFIIFGIVIAPMIIMGIFLINGKGAFLIAGYNTMKKAEKAKYDEKALCRSVGKFLFGVSFCMLLVPFGVIFDMSWLIYCFIAVTLAGSIGFAVYTNTGNRFRKNEGSEIPIEERRDISKSMNTKTVIIVVIVISAMLLTGIGILLYQGDKDPAISVLDDRVVIESMYGLSVDFTDITGISLIEESMSDIGAGSRTNGYSGFGEALKGNFKSDSIGEALLFVQSKTSPTICVERAGEKDIYISFRDSGATRELYAEMTDAFSER